MSGKFMQIDRDLNERNQWLLDNADAVQPFLSHGRECLVFTYASREPADRMSTRYGGLPYWSRRQRWPICRFCSILRPQPLSFIGQIDFRDSNAVDSTPGAVLVLHMCPFCSEDDSGASADEEAFWGDDAPIVLEDAAADKFDPKPGWSLTWQTVIPDEDLVAATDLPDIPDAPQVGPFYGQPRRAMDYPTPKEAYGGSIAGERHTYLYFNLQGTKLGGYKPAIQESDIPVDSRNFPMRFLGTFGSVSSVDEDSKTASRSSAVMFGDMGSVVLWMSESDGPVEMAWSIEGY